MFNTGQAEFMPHFDFHHHDPKKTFGIYNLPFDEETPPNFFSAGIHPDFLTENLEQKWEWLKITAQHENCVAIGECGLDARFGNHNLQNDVFKKQILLANSLQKPLIIHCVKSFPALISLLKIAEVPVIIHGFNKRKTIGKELLSHHFNLSFGKSLLYNVNLQAFFKEIPLTQFFIETDSGDVEIDELYLKAADLKKISVEELNFQIAENLKTIKIPLKNG